MLYRPPLDYSLALVGRLINRHLPLHIRAAALMSAAVLTVHQLRFQLAFGSRAGDRLAAEGHQYLGALAPLVAMLVAIGVGLFLAELAKARRYGSRVSGRRSTPTFAALWLLAAISLLVIYACQESLEGLLASGHPGGLAGVFGDGGLWAIPLSALGGALVALSLRATEAALDWAAERDAPALDSPRPAAFPRPLEVLPALCRPMAGSVAGRAPPAAVALTL
jgi:uncharacterized membrane protein YidH (DUF202 family)